MALEKAEFATKMLGALRQYSRAQDGDALVLAGLLSTLLHLALLKWLVVYLQTPAASTAVPEAEITLASSADIENEKAAAIKSGAQTSTPSSAPEIQARSPPADARPPDERRAPRGDAWAQSRVILSSQQLADPRNRKTVETLKLLEPQTRSQQLCDFEAILQINRQFDGYAVDFVVAYATEAVVRKGDAVIAHGAAFHSNGRWYNLSFECQLSANQRGVAHLKFKLGDAIGEERWADLNLPKAPANPLGGD
ncbi:MAG TPA: DUF930 domain-containing protein [Roseiarcus sp.]